MAKMNGDFLKNRNVGWYLLACASLLAVLCTAYYVFQSPADNAFDLLFLFPFVAGLVLTVLKLFTDIETLDFLTPLSAALFGVAFGVMVKDMLPTMSDVWNGIVFIGGNLTAYIIYTVLSFASAVLAITACFIGVTRKA